MRKRLIVNADDFGATEGVNRGLIESHENGIVTSASLMVRGAAAWSAAEYARGNPRLGVGLHVELAEWVYRDGEWALVYEVVPHQDASAVREELHRQIDSFCRLMGRLPDHLDSHQHVHRSEPSRAVMIDAARELNVPLRHFHPSIQYCGAFYGQTDVGAPYPQALDVGSLIEVLRGLPDGVTELCCHPGYADGLASAYRDEREREVRTLVDARVRQAVESGNIDLSRFDEAVD